MPEYPRKPFKKVGTSITPEVSGNTLDNTPIGTVTPKKGTFEYLAVSRDGSDEINIKESISNETAMRLKRQAANKYKASLPRIGSVQCNVCEKIALPTPTVSGWTTNPAPLSEIIDDDYEGLPTIGVVAVNGIGIVLFDLGEPYSLSIGVFHQKEGGTMQVQLSLDNVIFVTCPPNNTEPDAIIQSANGVGRYIRARLFAGAAERRLYSLGVSAIGAPLT